MKEEAKDEGVKEGPLGEQLRRMQNDLSACKVSREKWWTEIDADEKANRTRQELKRLQRDVSELKSMVTKLLQHDHKDNRIVYFETFPEYSIQYGHSPLTIGLGGHSLNPDEVYF